MEQPLAPGEGIAAQPDMVGGTGWNGVRRRYAVFREEVPMAVATSAILDIAMGGFSYERVARLQRDIIFGQVRLERAGIVPTRTKNEPDVAPRHQTRGARAEAQHRWCLKRGARARAQHRRPAHARGRKNRICANKGLRPPRLT